MTDNRLSGFQLFALSIFSGMLGVFAYAPSSHYILSPTWIWVVLALSVMQAISFWLISHAFSKTQSSGSFELLSTCFSSFSARMINILFGVYFLMRAAFSCAVQSVAIGQYMLEFTPTSIVLLIILASAFSAFYPGLRRLAGVAVLLFLILVIPLVFLIVIGLMRSDVAEMRVLLSPSVNEISSSIVPALISISGFESLIFFMGSSRSKPRAWKGIVIGIGVTFLALLSLFLISIGSIGSDGVAMAVFPFLEASRVINVGGVALTERFDMFLLIISLFASIIQIGVFACCGASALCAAFGLERRKSIALLLLPIVFIGAYIIKILGASTFAAVFITTGSIVILFFILPLAALISLLLKRPRKGEVKA